MDNGPNFSDDIQLWRSKALSAWDDLVNNYPARDLGSAAKQYAVEARNEVATIKLPRYFIDRYAYRIFKKTITGHPAKADLYRYLPISNELWTRKLSQVLHGITNFDVGPPDVMALIEPSEVLSDLLCRWRTFLSNHGIDFPPSFFVDPAGKPWAEFFRNSVHFPCRPAVLAPTFVDRLSSAERRVLVERVEVGGILALYIFLVQVHEECHLLQSGEPMLCRYT